MDYISEIQRLQPHLPGVDIEFLEDYTNHVYGDFDWSYDYNECEINISMHFRDWQVQRMFVVGMNDKLSWVNPKTHNRITMNSQDYDRWCEANNHDNEDMFEDEYADLEQYMETTNEGEFLQYWLHVPTGRLFINERLEDRNGKPHLYVGGEWKLREPNADDFKSNDGVYYFDMSVHPILKRNGWKRKDDITEDDYTGFWYHHSRMHYMQLLLTDPQTEWLFKMCNKQFLDELDRKPDDMMQDFITAFRIVKRYHYDQRKDFDLNLWFDLVEALILFHRDIHNPHYVCPEDFMATHDLWTRRKEREHERIEEERQAKSDAEHQQEYYNRVERFKDIRLEHPAFVITPCLSIKEMRAEGKALHHCVGGYWRQENALILFCRDHAGNRISTIELNTQGWHIVQNRGLQNIVPPFREEANALIMQHIDLFRNAKPHTEEEREKVLIPAGREPEPQLQLAAIPMAA